MVCTWVSQLDPKGGRTVLPGIRSSPRSLPPSSILCTSLTICSRPIDNTFFPSLGTTSLVQSSTVTTLIKSPGDPGSRVGSISKLGETGMSCGDADSGLI